MEKDLISVIVPIYNVEKYMGYCLNSICNQIYKNLEIILVDDASTDNSGKLCEEYAAKDSRIICIHHENNQGLSAARNHGVEKASGKYVVFVDGDDEIEYNMVEILYEAINKYNVPVARCGARRVNKLGVLKEDGINEKIIKYEVLEGWKYLIKYDRCSACCGMYEIGLAKKMKFPNGLSFEDYYLLPRLFCKVNKIVYVGNAMLYHWYIRTGSITQTSYQRGLDPDFTLVTLKNLEYFKKTYNEKSFTFLIMQEFMLRRFVSEYLYTRKYDGKFLINYRKCIMQNICTILRNTYIGWRLKFAIFYLFCFPKSARTVLNIEKIKEQQKDIIKEKVRI